MVKAAAPPEGEGDVLLDPARLDDPFADLAALRERHPVFHHRRLGQWFVLAHAEVTACFADPRLSADRMRGFVDAAPEAVRPELRRVAPFLQTWLLMKDGAEHARIRGQLHRGFDARAVAGLEGSIRRATAELLASAAHDGRMDAGNDFAFLLPAYVLSDFMGVAPEDRDQVVRWSVDFVDFFNVIPITADTTARMVRSTGEMAAYTRRLLEMRRREPADDFLGVLAAAGDEGLSDDEIIGNTMLLLIAGHVAVRNLIGNMVWLLLQHPDQRALLAADPALIEGLVEESLRFEPPVTLIPRIALEDVEVGGEAIPAGGVVQLSIAAANRDPAAFPDPDRFDITRPRGPLLSFGHGPHGCLGARLARMQARIAVQALLERHPHLRADPDRPPTWYRNAGNRGPITLPLILD